MERKNEPFKGLGNALKNIRTRLQESVAEVSGAVEIDGDKLVQFENGVNRPSEDILELLISHFAVKEEEAAKLWELAGYDDPKMQNVEEAQVVNQPIMLLPFDARVIYTDSMNVVINNNGVVINFMQNSTGGQQLPSARVGMSLEQAQRVATTLQETINTAIEQSSKKQLPGSNGPKNKK